jgi:hypothetical protein
VAPKEVWGVHHQFVIPAIVIDTYSSEDLPSESDLSTRKMKFQTTSLPEIVITSGASSSVTTTCCGGICSTTTASNNGAPQVDLDSIANPVDSKQCFNGSRSESPLSENGNQCFIYCPQFFNSTGKELLYTDSDGLYDCPSSEVNPSDSPTNKGQGKQKPKPGKRTGRKRERARKQPVSCAAGKSNEPDEATNNEQGRISTGSPGYIKFSFNRFFIFRVPDEFF